MELPASEDGNENHPTSLRKRRRARRRAIMKQLWSDYTQNTSLHGLKYTTQSGIHYAERIFWIVTFTLSLGMCLWLIHNVWHKWQTSPVIVSFSEKIVPVEMVPFPSLTICPQIKAKATVYNYTKHFGLYFTDGGLSELNLWLNSNFSDNFTQLGPDPQDMKTFQDVSLVCPLPFYMPTYDFNALPGPNVTNISTINKILEVSPGLEYFQACYLLGEETTCSDMFSRVLTDEGVCFNFNGLPAHEIFRIKNIQKDYPYSEVKRNISGWNPIKGYNNSDEVDYSTQYPYRGQYNRHRPYLEVVLMTPKNDSDGYCNVINKGYKVYTQHPNSHPQSSVYSYAILPGQLSALALKVNMMNTSSKLVNYDSEVRQCFFSSEKYLRYFKTYSASNCLLECLSNYTYKMCQCVSFHMPFINSTSICTLQKADCLAKFRGSNLKLMEYIEECNCLPSCSSISYEAEILKTEFNLEKSFTNFFKLLKVFETDDIGDLFSSYEYSKLDVYYRDSGFVTITRSELFGVTDFLANIGGLLGLFLGFSFLSLIEIVYFFTIRLGFTFHKDISREKQNIQSQPANIEEADIGVPKIKHM